MSRVSEFVRGMFAHIPVGAEAREQVLGLLAGVDRRYHGLGHVALLWRRHLRHACGAHLTAPLPTRLIASAIAYHDAVYEPGAQDNEVRSAALWRDHAAAGPMSPREVEFVAGTILATADHFGYVAVTHPWEAARLWMLDLDLTPLGETPAEFARNTDLLRAEYDHLSAADWASGRARFLESLSRCPALYRTGPLREAFEQSARRNIAASLACLRQG